MIAGKGRGKFLVQELEKAQYTIEILSYLFLAPRRPGKGGIIDDIVKAFQKKMQEGVHIQILMNGKYPKGWINNREIEERRRLRRINIDVRTYPRHNIMHSKLILIDRKIAILGSANLTKESLENNHEILLKITEQKTVQRLGEIFFYAWKESTHE